MGVFFLDEGSADRTSASDPDLDLPLAIPFAKSRHFLSPL
jgi:hypothetical protein